MSSMLFAIRHGARASCSSSLFIGQPLLPICVKHKPSLNSGISKLSTFTLKSTTPQAIRNAKCVLTTHALSTTCSRSESDTKTSSGEHVAFTKNSSNTEENETHGQPLHRFGSSDKLEQAAGRFDLLQHEGTTHVNDYQVDISSEHHADVYNHIPSVNLSSCMQSQVPEPYGKTPTHMNMPGGVSRREHKYIQGRLSDMTGQREFSTSAFIRAQQQLDEHGNPTFESAEQILRDPCPQGIQGEDCEQFKLWLSNCLQHGDQQKCERLANEYIAGRKTLAQLFLEYDIEIQRVATARQEALNKAAAAVNESLAQDIIPPVTPTRAAKLKAAVRDYGSTVIVFHIGIALTSLGMFYTLVASNVDVLGILRYFNISLGAAQATVSTASTFAVAYAVHKVFAPVRIAITLTCAPLIVRALRARGILKAPKAPKSPPA